MQCMHLVNQYLSKVYLMKEIRDLRIKENTFAQHQGLTVQDGRQVINMYLQQTVLIEL